MLCTSNNKPDLDIARHTFFILITVVLQVFGVYVAFKYRNIKDPNSVSGSFL